MMQFSQTQRTLPSNFICPVRYGNSLPKIPFEPKSLAYKFDLKRFTGYTDTSLDKRQKHMLWTERDLGVPIDLVNPDTYKVDPAVVLGSDDRSLLGAVVQEAPTISRSRSSVTAKNVTSIGKPVYPSREVEGYSASNMKAKGKVGEPGKRCSITKENHKDIGSRIAAIEKTFEEAKKPIARLPGRAGVTPVQVLPVFPDFKMWGNQYTQVVFDSDPAPGDMSAPMDVEIASQALIKTTGEDEAVGSECVGYFLPSKESGTPLDHKREAGKKPSATRKRKRNYHLAQEYDCEVKNKASKDYEETYSFVFRDGEGVYFNQLDNKMLLSKRRKTSKSGEGTQLSTNTTKLRDVNKKDLRVQKNHKAPR